MVMQNLYWDDYPAIAEELNIHFPEEDLLDIDDARLKELVGSLKNFKDNPDNPPEDILSAILTVWIRIQGGDDEGFDDGCWDAWA